jgi:hypothetical protein
VLASSWRVGAEARRGFVTVTATLNGRSGSEIVRFQLVGS